MRYRVQVLGWALIWSGLFVFGYLGWQIFVTDYINAGVQREAAGDLEVTLEEVEPEPEQVDRDEFLGETDEPPVAIPEVVEYYPEDAVGVGESFAFLTIPKIGLDGVVVYEGVDRETLKNGPGHMERTPLPGQPGNSVISGHRTTYGRPFFDFDLLVVGDRVEVETTTGTHVYEVRETLIVEPTDVWVTDPRPGGWLTMTTCNPKFSAKERLIVFAEMVAGPNLDYINLQEVSVQAS
ncbi:MAG TPA: sortase [Acidimicrobiia bacterium]|nr:sortase [Acidimicrobiia bacterium]